MMMAMDTKMATTVKKSAPSLKNPNAAPVFDELIIRAYGANHSHGAHRSCGAKLSRTKYFDH